NFSGAASGINNAMTRISNVFANAIFGALAVLFFAGTLQGKIQSAQLDAKNKQEIIAQSANLGDAKAPSSLSAQEKTAIQNAYRESFISAYANIMRLSAGLAFLGALMTVFFIRNRTVKKE
ncbi:MAG TPA: MFS transporter, partial [Mucilaginibacter sp.]|nr:MFS transporter [Mucilaginibacter sp.]